MLIYYHKLIGMEGTKTPRNCYRNFFVRGQIPRSYSTSCGRSETGETPQTRSVEEARRSPAESVVPEMEINNQI
jgi:hypothetical protein